MSFSTHSSLKPVDIETMKNLGEFVNLVPVIGKSDSLTLEERQDFKKRVSHFRYSLQSVLPGLTSSLAAD